MPVIFPCITTGKQVQTDTPHGNSRIKSRGEHIRPWSLGSWLAHCHFCIISWAKKSYAQVKRQWSSPYPPRVLDQKKRKGWGKYFTHWFDWNLKYFIMSAEIWGLSESQTKNYVHLLLKLLCNNRTSQLLLSTKTWIFIWKFYVSS